VKDVAPRKALIVTIGILTGTAVLVAAVFLLFPVLWTGPFCEITIDAVDVGSDGRLKMSYRERTTAGASVVIYALRKSQMKIIARNFPAWPVKDRDVIELSLFTEQEEKDGVKLSPEIRQRVLVEAGTVHLLRPGDRLVYFRRPYGNGTTIDGYIEVNP
jgi:hypothetical protein